MAAKKQTQVIDIKAEKSFTSKGESNEILRVASNGAYLANLSNAFDPTREHLDFEIKNGKIVPLDKKIAIGKRMRMNIKKRGIKDPNEGKEIPTRRVLASFIIGGSQEQMRKLAFGDQTVNYDKGADNSFVSRQKSIENWALDVYDFMAKKYGEENIAAFVVHLDETNPHIHCKIIPVDEKNKISFRKVFVGPDNTKNAFSQSTIQLHNEFYEQVSKKYGLERGEHISETNAKHRTTEEYHAERRAKLKEEVEKLEKEKSDKIDELENLNHDIKHAQAKVKALNTMIFNLQKQIADLQEEIAALEADRDAGRISNEEADRRMQRLQAYLNNANEKLLDKNKKLEDAEKELKEIKDKIADKQKESDLLEQKISKGLPLVKKQTFSDMNNIGFENSIKSLRSFFEKYDNLLESSLPEQRDYLDSSVTPLLDNAIFKDIADNAVQLAQVASYLFLGYLDKATQLSESCGGGGAPDSGWGKRDDEDNEAFKRRCYLMGMKMMKATRKEKRKGIRR